MKHVEILPLSGTGVREAIFTYSTSKDIKIGSLVQIPLKNRTVKGFVLRYVKKPPFATKDIKKILSPEPVLTENQLNLAQKIADYYFCNVADVISTILPFEFGKKRRAIKKPRIKNSRLEIPHQLTPDQQNIFKTIKNDTKSARYLLFGVTGSGKTEIYLQLVADALKKGKSSIILVPEISLTPQALERFTKRFGSTVAVWHSGLLETEKFDIWHKIKSGEKKVILGARSAIFAPVSDLAYIFIDEEHENSYKQDQNPRYETGRVAEWLSDATGAKLVLGSATPKIETFYRANKNEYKLLTMSKRIVQKSMPPTKIVDMRDEFKKGNYSIFSDDLFELIEHTLKEKKQVLLFLNRRGASTFVTCRDCGYVVECPNCEIPLTYHPLESKTGFKNPRSPSLICHHCGYTQGIPVVCPKCKSVAIKYFGLGTQKVELECKKLFPKAQIARMDRDTTKRRGSHGEIYEGFARKDFDILIGTQMIAKGWDMPEVQAVGVISADTMLHLPDFKSAERTFSLLTQVAGRTGRGFHPGNVIIQTYNPENYAIKFAANHDYSGFYEREIKERKKYDYPPFSNVVKLTFGTINEQKAQETMDAFKKTLEAEINQNEATILGPTPSFLPKLRNKFRFQVVIKAVNEKSLSKTLKVIEKNYVRGITVDVNPESLL